MPFQYASLQMLYKEEKPIMCNSIYVKRDNRARSYTLLWTNLFSLRTCAIIVSIPPKYVQNNEEFTCCIVYFQTLIAPSLLPDNRSLWFNFTEAKDKMESRWQPAESVAAAARIAFVVNFVDRGRLLISCLTENRE